MTIPTEPIGSIPRPLRLIEAIAATDGADPSLDPLYDEAIRDTIERFEATGSPVITDGEQRKYHNFWTYCVHGLPNTAPDGFKIPFSAGHTRRMPRLTAGPFRYQQACGQLPGRGPALRPRAGEAGGHLALGPEPDVPGRRDPRLSPRAVHRRPAARARDRGPQLPAEGCAQGPDRLHGGAAGGQDRPLRRSPAQLHRPEQPRAVAVLRRGPQAHRRAHLPRQRPRLDPQRGRRLRRAAAQPVRAEGREFLHRPGGREGPRPRPEDHPRSHEAGPAGLRRRRLADRPARRDAGGSPGPGPRGGPVHPGRATGHDRRLRVLAVLRRHDDDPRHGLRQDPGARDRHAIWRRKSLGGG